MEIERPQIRELNVSGSIGLFFLVKGFQAIANFK